ncbi:PilZ domain-containing protein [Qipengyuania flava]|uniref:PilZ domain-containing protein n=1 Tax=Qipengyuania flava TaxID=192812 RepID=UPI001C628397|nr:PilZ domain-containing protein [Qipengyuania flava]QYJ06467.1 PilZ domain-containing protein [Qipengyuania flava]
MKLLPEVSGRMADPAAPRAAGGQPAASALDLATRNGAVKVMRPCGIELGDKVLPGILRALSHQGGQIEVLHPIEPGTRIAYFADGDRALPAHVLWAERGLIGFRNLRPIQPRHSLRPRCARIPCSIPVEVEAGGGLHRARIVNASMRGVQLLDLPPTEFDTPLIVRSEDGRSFSGVTRWHRAGRTGVYLRSAMGLPDLTELIETQFPESERGEAQARVRTGDSPPDNRISDRQLAYWKDVLHG